MNIVIAYSVNDIAGKGIAYDIIRHINCDKYYDYLGLENLKEVFICKDRGIYILGFEVDVVEFEALERLSAVAKYFVIVSKHSAKSEKASLTTHPPGNPWGRSDVGGKPWEMPPSNPVLMWYTLKELRRYSIENGLHNYEVCYEVTHHGPTSLSKPVTFIELGSNEKEWINSKAHKAVALATLSALEKTEFENHDCIVTVGFGGSHYAPIFTKRAFEENECYGHMIPNYVIKEISLEELRIIAKKAFRLTPGVKRVVIEKMRKELRNIIEEEAHTHRLEIIKY